MAGAFGALTRYAVQGWINDVLGPTLLSTFAVNVSGSFLLGVLVAVTEGRFSLPANTRIVLGVGFLGAYTTFSTLMFESMDRIETGSTAAALLNLGGSVAVGMVAVYAGLTLGRTL